MAQASVLKYLRPCAGGHSIYEAVFTIHLSTETPVPNLLTFSDIHNGVFKKSFPKLQHLKQMSGLVSTDNSTESASVQMGPLQTYGFSFEAYKPDGSLKRRIRAENLEKPWIAVNFLEYERWDNIQKKAHGWFNKISAHIKRLKSEQHPVVVSLGLHYIDHFYWESQEKPDLTKIFNKDSIFLPARFQDDFDGWNCKIGYSHLKNGYRHIDNVRVLIETKPENNHRRFIIDMPLRVDLKKPLLLKDFLKNLEEGGFLDLSNRLHNDNKAFLADLLTKPVQKRIGLKP